MRVRARHGRSGGEPNVVGSCRHTEGVREQRRRARRGRPGRHRPKRGPHGVTRGRNLLVGASVMVAVGMLATGDEPEVSRLSSSTAAVARTVPPPGITDRRADRASRRDRAENRRTGMVPTPNSATRAKPTPEPKPEPAWVVPTQNYRLTSGYGYRWGAMHAGVDLAAPTGTPVRSMRAGTVEVAGWYGGYGYAVIVDHGAGVSTLYGHNSRVVVEAGERVGTGQRIALMGSTGNSTGPHLHLEVHIGDEPVSPVPWLRDRGLRL